MNSNPDCVLTWEDGIVEQEHKTTCSIFNFILQLVDCDIRRLKKHKIPVSPDTDNINMKVPGTNTFEIHVFSVIELTVFR